MRNCAIDKGVGTAWPTKELTEIKKEKNHELEN